MDNVSTHNALKINTIFFSLYVQRVKPFLQYLARAKGQDRFNEKRLQRCIYFKALDNGIF